MALAALGGLAFAGPGMAGRMLGGPPRPPLPADPLAWVLVAYIGLGLLFYGLPSSGGR